MKNRTLTLIICLTAYALAGSSIFAQSQGPANIWTSGTNKGQFANPLIVPANSGTAANQFANGADTKAALDGKLPATRMLGTGTLTVNSTGTIGSAAFTESTAYATSAQGGLADSALQPGEAAGDISGGSGTLDLSIYTLTLPADVTRLGSSIDLASEVTGTLPGASVQAASGTTSGIITDSTQTVGGDKTFNGQISAPNQTADSAGKMMTRALADDRIVGAMLSGKMISPALHGALWFSATAGTGSVTTATGTSTSNTGPIVLDLNTGATSSSWAFASLNRTGLGYPLVAPGGSSINWAGRNRFSIRFKISNSDSNAIFRFSAGEASTTAAPTDLTRSGVGIKIENLSLKVMVHNNSTLTVSSSIATLSTNTVYVIVLDSDGSGNITPTLNGTSYSAVTGGPTATNGTANSTIFFSADNGASAATCRWQIENLTIFLGTL